MALAIDRLEGMDPHTGPAEIVGVLGQFTPPPGRDKVNCVETNTNRLTSNDLITPVMK
jgi:hypothetical protein